MFARGSPDLVFGEGESFVDLIHGQQLLFSPPAGTGEVGEINGLSSFGIDQALSGALVIAEAVLDTDDDPAQ